MAKRIARITKEEELTVQINYEIDRAIRSETSDRATALIAAAFVELRLRFAIERRLVDEPKRTELLFNEYGPLFMLHARIYAAYALGIFGEKAFADLKIVRDIRNAFAHNIEPISFTHPDIAKLCASFYLPTRIKPMIYGDVSPWPPTDPKMLYIAATALLCSGLFTEAVKYERKAYTPYYLKW